MSSINNNVSNNHISNQNTSTVPDQPADSLDSINIKTSEAEAPAVKLDSVEITGSNDKKASGDNAAARAMSAGAQSTESNASALGAIIGVIGGIVGVLTSWTGVGAAVGAGLMLVGAAISEGGSSAAEGEAAAAKQVQKGEEGSGQLVKVDDVVIPDEKKAAPNVEEASGGATSTLSVLEESQNSMV